MATKIIKFKDENTTYLPVTDAKVVQYDNSGTKISVQDAIDNTKNDILNTNHIYFGTCTTAKGTAAKIVTTEQFPLDGQRPKNGTIICVWFSATNTASNPTLNVNETGAKRVWYNTGLIASSSVGMAGTTKKHNFFMYHYDTDLGHDYWISIDVNTTYSAMTQAEIDTGTSASSRLIAPKMLRDNFYTESEVDALLPVDFDGRQHGLVPMPRASETVMVLGSDGQWKTVTAAQTVQISYNLKYCEASSHLNEYIDETLWGNFADPTVATSVFIDDINVSLT